MIVTFGLSFISGVWVIPNYVCFPTETPLGNSLCSCQCIMSLKGKQLDFFKHVSIYLEVFLRGKNQHLQFSPFWINISSQNLYLLQQLFTLVFVHTYSKDAF